MKVVSGDLLRLTKEGKFDVIIHGCNCFCRMGAGIAKSIKEEFPQAYEADCATVPGVRDKLGTMTSAKVSLVLSQYSPPPSSSSSSSSSTDITPWQGKPPSRQRHRDHEVVIVNAYTQFHWHREKDECLLEYEALRAVFSAVKREYSGRRIAYPKIGAGLAGGDWKVISEIIDQELEGEDHTYVEYLQLSQESRTNN